MLALFYAVMVTGAIPSPQWVLGLFGRASSVRYPCEACGCGCASAEECWTACCCHTLHERLVWAIENGVMPPASVEVTDEQWIAAANQVEPGSAHCGLCASQVKARLEAGIPSAEPAFADRVAEQFGAGVKSCCSSSTPECSKPVEKTAAKWPAFSPATCKRLSILMAAALPSTLGNRTCLVLPPQETAPTPRFVIADVATGRPLDIPTPPPRMPA